MAVTSSHDKVSSTMTVSAQRWRSLELLLRCQGRAARAAFCVSGTNSPHKQGGTRRRILDCVMAAAAGAAGAVQPAAAVNPTIPD